MKTGIEQNEVLRMAREAGCNEEFCKMAPDWLERFAALVREYEREKIVLAHKIRPRGKSVYHEFLAEREKQQEPNCYGDGNVYRGVRNKDSEIQTVVVTIEAAVLAEREQCAKVCEKFRKMYREAGHKGNEAIAKGIFMVEQSIRARGE